ncbi:MAG: winged helix-turn-helix transcriptional regulator [Devosia sp.]|jgi:DNA-binding MarR family transcriptional regulator|uniref:MarR family winged helix-turn-helix transcriptional regulator n=1 Tax=unclassified Devosia TaxID=196773 RepID=UPI0019E71042|nr:MULTISPECIES: MarR family winged helix-turn-helix transcriptional regulator [unclassified Devosia]MBF0680182.1 winged helix-turn-helix transcriptional regulator [Devosia sp.]WEJ34945.1 MarR family winged helix-turn-helix transcriptional regulator [Devosia sp. SD17-2]
MPKNDVVLEQEESETGSAVDAQLGLVGYRLRRAQLSVFQRFLAVFAELSLRPAEYSTLVLIGENPGRKQTEIASALGVKRANFVALVDGLQARGLLERVHVKTDRRANALHLTSEGEQFLARARKLHEELEQEFIDRLGGDAKRDQLLALLERLT